MADKWPSGPLTRATAITPNNSTNIGPYAALYIGGAGDVKVDTIDGDTVTFTAHPVGYMPISVKRVYATGTGATFILGLS